MARIRHGIEYCFVVGFFLLVKLTPIRFGPLLARFFGTLSHLLTPKRVKIALDQVREAFPERNDTELRKTVKTLYRNLAGNAVDSVRPLALVRQIELDEAARLRLEEIERLAATRPVVLVSGHYGDWELLAVFLATRFKGLNVLAQTQSNPYVDRLINRQRTVTGLRIVPSHQAPRLLSPRFRDGETFYFVSDQDGGSEGIFVEFLGRETSYARGLALYSYRYAAPVVPVFLKRHNPGYTLEIDAPIEPDVSADKNSEIRRIITAYSAALARKVREHPEQWLWTHRRWKSAPLEKTPK